MLTQSTFGSYETLEIIGEGGMGTVYRGRDPRFDRPVAVKVLHDSFRRDPAILERFRAEAVVQARLSHPNIVTVYDFVADERGLGMVLEYVDGLTLDELIERNGGPLPPDRAIHIMNQVLSAIGYAHQLGLVHRDLKPSNIMIQERGGEEIAKVMDFGIVKILGAEKVRTATSAKMGTLAYMSPEQLKSPRNADVRSDVYSLGATLFEMLTGQLPFDADSEYELMRRIVEEPVPRVVTPGSIPAKLEAAVCRALEKDPAMRFQSCAEFREALARATAAPATYPGTPVQPLQVPFVPAPAEPARPAFAPPRAETPARTEPEASARVSQAPAPTFAQPAAVASKSPIALILVALVALAAAIGGFLYYRATHSFAARLDAALAQDRLFSPPGDCVADLYAAEKAKNPSSPDLAAAGGKIGAKLSPVSDEAFRKWYADSDGVDWSQIEKVSAFLVELRPADATAQARHEYALGTLSLQSQQHAEALRHFEAALQHDGQFVLAVNGIAKVYVQDSSPLKNEAAALQYYERAASMDPRFTWPLKNLGEYYMRQENWTAAESYMQRALATSPERPSILRALARIYYNQQRFSEALDYNQRFIRVATDPSEVQKANQAIDAIRTKLQN